MTSNIQRYKVPGYARAPRTQDPSLILIHSTRGQTTMEKQFQSTVNWFMQAPNQGGWASGADVCIGASGEVAVFYSDDDGDYTRSHATWSAGYGDGNTTEWGADEVAISIELAQPDNDTPYTSACIDALVEFVRPLLKQYGIPAKRVWFTDQRRDWAPPKGLTGHDNTENGVKLGKSDPGKLFPWDDVIARLGQTWEQAAGVASLPTITDDTIKVGRVVPVVMHHGATPEQVKRMQMGYSKAAVYMQRWFQREVGLVPYVTDAIPVDTTLLNPKRPLEDFLRDCWSNALGAAADVGLPVWKENAVVAILVDKVPYTTLGLGGASSTIAPWKSGVVVKDGDAMEVFARGYTGEPHDPVSYGQNVAMMCHELLHAFNANAHQDVAGNNIEYEWWAGLAADIAPENKEALLANSVFFQKTGAGTGSSGTPTPEPPPTVPDPPATPPAGQLTREQLEQLQLIRKGLHGSAAVLDAILLAQGVPAN